MEKLTLEQAYSLASGHFLTEYIPLELLEALDDDWLPVYVFIEEHLTELLEGSEGGAIWELIEEIGLNYYKLVNSGVTL